MKRTPKLEGPVFPVITAFRADGAVDFESTEEYIRWLCEEGAKVVYLMEHSSRLRHLLREEIYDLNSLCADIKKDFPEVFFIGAAPSFGGSLSIKCLVKTFSSRLDAISVIFPERFYRTEQLVEFYRTVSAEGPVMVHAERLANPWGEERVLWPLDALYTVMALPGVVGMKDDMKDDATTYGILKNIEKPIILSGGSKEQWMQFPVAAGYLVGLGSVMPEVAVNFWKGGRAEREELIENYEKPFFAVAKTIGWHIGIKAALALHGHMEVFERAPMVSASTEDIERIRKVLEDLCK